MIKLINNITQIIILLGCCAILIFTLSIAIAFAKNDFATITNIYNYIYMLNVSMKLNHITFMAIILMLLNMKQLVTLSFAIKNTKEERNKIIKYMNYYFSIPIQETYNLLNIAYVAKLGYFRGIDFELDFPDKYTEEDMFKKLKTVFSDVSFTCQINNKNFEHDISIESENKKVKPTNRNTTNTSVTIEEALKEEFVIIHKKDLIELQKSKHVLKDLLGTIENLNNKLKQICDDIRTISES